MSSLTCACCACADERLRGSKVCDREGNLKPDTHFIFSALPDSSLVAEGQPALELGLALRSVTSQALLLRVTTVVRGGANILRVVP